MSSVFPHPIPPGMRRHKVKPRALDLKDYRIYAHREDGMATWICPICRNGNHYEKRDSQYVCSECHFPFYVHDYHIFQSF